MEAIKIYKQKAKASLKDNWDNAAVIMLVYCAIAVSVSSFGEMFAHFSLLSSVSFQIITTIMIWPLGWSAYTIFLSIAHGEVLKFNNLWKGYSDENIVRVLSTNLIIALLFSVIILCLMVLPIVILIMSEVKMSIVYAIMIPLFVILIMIPSIYFSMTFFIMYDDREMKNLRAIRLSVNMIKRHFWQFVLLNLSFIGWFLLACLTLGVGFLWLLPYIYTTQAHFYKDLKAEQEMLFFENKETIA